MPSSVAFPSSQSDAPKTPLRSRFPTITSPFSKRKPTQTELVSSTSTPVKPSLVTSGADAYPTPSKEKDREKTRADSQRERKVSSVEVAGRAREHLASLLNKSSLDAAEKKGLSPAKVELIETLHAIRARSVSNASVSSVATLRPTHPSMIAYGAGRKRERIDSTSTTPSFAVPSRKRERVDSTSSTASSIYDPDKENSKVQNSKRVRLHSSASTTIGPPAAALTARATVELAQRSVQEHQGSFLDVDDDEEEAEVLGMLSVEEEEWGPTTKQAPRAVRPLKSRVGAPHPLKQQDSTCAQITPALAHSSIRTPPEENFPSIPSPPESPVRTIASSRKVSLADEFALVNSAHAAKKANVHYSLTLDIAHAAFWDVDPTAEEPLAVHGNIHLLASPPTSSPPDVAVESSCTISPVQRGLGRAAWPQEQEPSVDVVVMPVWTKIRGVWTASVELRVPPALFASAETRALSLSLDADVLLPRGAGGINLTAATELSVSALSTPREMALSVADRRQLEGVARERAEKRELVALMREKERERFMTLEFEDMTPMERRQYKRWLDSQEDVF